MKNPPLSSFLGVEWELFAVYHQSFPLLLGGVTNPVIVKSTTLGNPTSLHVVVKTRTVFVRLIFTTQRDEDFRRANFGEGTITAEFQK